MKYAELFTGIGGFRFGIEKAIKGSECVGYSEIDKYAQAIYEYKYPGTRNYGDCGTIRSGDIPDIDLLVGGFPCQSFSIAGKRGGFSDTRGTLFFDIARLARDKQPRGLLLENVKGLLSHKDGVTFQKILEVLTDIGYILQWEVLNSVNYGVAQNRERVFLVGHLRGQPRPEVFPVGESETISGKKDSRQQKDGKRICSTIDSRYGALRNSGETYITSGTLRTHKDGRGFREMSSDISPTIPARAREDGSGQPCVAIQRGHGFFKGSIDEEVAPTIRGASVAHNVHIVKPVLTPDRPEKRQNGRRFKEDGEPMFTLTAQDRHGIMENSEIRRLTPLECERLQAFPDDWTKYGVFDGEVKEISDTQRYKCLGNAVTTSVIEYIIGKYFS